MDRRILIGSLALGTFAVPRAASTQPERKVYRIGILSLRATAPRRGPAGHGAAGRRDRGGPSPLNRRHYPRGNCSRARARRRWTARRRAVPSAPGEVGHVQIWLVCHAAPHPTAAPRPGPRPTPFMRTTLSCAPVCAADSASVPLARFQALQPCRRWRRPARQELDELGRGRAATPRWARCSSAPPPAMSERTSGCLLGMSHTASA